MKEIWKNAWPHILAVILFFTLSFAYFSPLLEGKVLYQSDIANYRGMSKEIWDHREAYGEEPLWTNSLFAGMPAYFNSVRYPGNLIHSIFFEPIKSIPAPANYLFLLFLGFYVLLAGLKYNPRLSFIGAIAFGLSTYWFLIMEAGHNNKTWAVALFAPVLLGILTVFHRKRLVAGGLITALALAWEIDVNHIQMTYYLGIAVFILGIFELVQAVKDKTLPDFGKQLAVLLLALGLAVGTNAGRLITSYDYGKYSTRGKSELTIDDLAGTNKTDGLDRDYITNWSYGIAESFNVFIPGLMGGASTEALDRDSHLGEAIRGRVQNPDQVLQSIPTYWGEQPFVSGPYYMGAVVVFLFFFGLFYLKHRYKWWLLVATVLIFDLSWGKNMMWLTDLFIDYVPMYDKFRAVASILVVAMLTLPLLGFMALRQLFYEEFNRDEALKAIKMGGGLAAGLALLFALLGGSLFDFEGLRDDVFANAGLLNDLIEDRKAMLRADAWRSFIFVALAAASLWAFVTGKLKREMALSALGLLIIVDLWTVNKRYLNDDDFVSKRQMENPFTPTQADMQIMQDNDPNYRVYNLGERLDAGARTAYFHKSLGGYHPAKLKRYQELVDNQINKRNQAVINMLNVKYFIVPDQNSGQVRAQMNPGNLGDAWFVENVRIVPNANAEMTALNDFDPAATAIVDERFAGQLSGVEPQADPSATVVLQEIKSNYLKYQTSTSKDQVLIMSEIYFGYEGRGWKAYIDGEYAPHFQANYVLRGMVVPAGSHSIEFKFEPTLYYTGEKISMASSTILLLGSLALLFFQWRKTCEETA